MTMFEGIAGHTAPDELIRFINKKIKENKGKPETTKVLREVINEVKRLKKQIQSSKF